MQRPEGPVKQISQLCRQPLANSARQDVDTAAYLAELFPEAILTGLIL
jgi:hypothetical protein